MATITVDADGYRIDRGPEITSTCPLAAAIRAAEDLTTDREGVTIVVVGQVLRGLDVGGPSGYQNKDNCGYWRKRPIERLTIVGNGERSAIGPLRFWDGLNGVDSITIKALRIINEPNEFAPIRTAMNEVHGHITIEGCTIHGSGTNWNGLGMKWGVRGHGPAKWTIKDVFVEPAQEHSLYIDNPQGNTLIDRVTGGGNGRTFIQITNRPTSGPSQSGDIMVSNCLCRDINDDGGGGSDYTFVGCVGTLTVKDCTSYNTTNGALVCWTDTHNGTYPIGDHLDYSFKNVVIQNFTASSRRASRPMIALSGVFVGKIIDAKIDTPGIKYRLGGPYGGPRPNGNIEIV